MLRSPQLYPSAAARPVFRYMLPLAVLSALQLASQLAPASAHSFLLKPGPYNQRWLTKSCRGSQCTNACPEIDFPWRMKNHWNDPAETWRRGQRITIAWARNNHHGGMVRIALVPVNLFNQRDWHKRFTLFHTCWDAGEYKCGKNCGSDKSNRGFRRMVEVPCQYPDGVYVLGYVWYGGLHFSRDHGQFPDFYSCSFIRIRGGASVCKGKSYKPYYEPGPGRKVVRGKCHTSSDRIGTCGHTGCWKKRAFYQVPEVFQPGKKRPKSFRTADIVSAFKAKSPDRCLINAICKGFKVCCPLGCGGCGGRNCAKMPLGRENCCVSGVMKQKRDCSKVCAPCTRT